MPEEKKIKTWLILFCESSFVLLTLIALTCYVYMQTIQGNILTSPIIGAISLLFQLWPEFLHFLVLSVTFFFVAVTFILRSINNIVN